jgi:transcriptional regulator with XRE-family HTH domain
MTRDELAKAARISPNTVADWERGKIRNPRDLFHRLESVLNLSLPNLQQALAIVRAQRSDECAEAYAGPKYEIRDGPALDPLGMTDREIEVEIGQLYSEIGRIETRVHLLNTELAVRHGILRPRG